MFAEKTVRLRASLGREIAVIDRAMLPQVGRGDEFMIGTRRGVGCDHVSFENHAQHVGIIVERVEHRDLAVDPDGFRRLLDKIHSRWNVAHRK